MTHLRLICALLVLTAGLPAPGSAEDTEAPLVDAGLDQTVTRGSTVYLDAGGTVDADGEVVDYSWRIETPRGRSIRPTDPDAELTRFVPNSTGRYRVTLTATDDDDNSRSDTLYVDVSAGAQPPGTSPPSDGPPDANDPGSQTPPPQSDFQPPGDRTGPPNSDVGPIADDSSNANQAPYGQIYGPNSVKAGRTGRYSLQATDQDGHIIDYWWVPPGELTGQGRELEAHTVGKSYSFDVEPGTTVEIPVVIMDNDGARSSISKTVQVANNQPQATLVGNETVVVGSVNRYEAVASDPDGPIIEYDWEADSSVESVNTGGLLGGQSSSGRSTLYRFTEIPQDDATATVSLTVKDEHGGQRMVKKEVTVLNLKKTKGIENESYEDPVISSLTGHTVPGGESVFGSLDISNHKEFKFTANAEDSDSNRLIYHWEFGQRGSARTVETGNDTSSTVSFMFQDQDALEDTVDISVTVEDQTGRTVTSVRTMTLKPGGVERTNARDLHIKNLGDGLISVELTLSQRSSYDVTQLEISFGDGTQTSFPVNQSNSNQLQAHFEHQYDFGGTYTVYVFDGGNQGLKYGREDVVVNKRSYVEWTYERKSEIKQQTQSKERPGEEWSRSGVDHVEQTHVDTLRRATPIIGRTTVRPGPSWERVSTTVEYRTEHRTTRGIEQPGPEWVISKRNVDERKVIDEWQSVVVQDKGIADSSWEYKRAVPRTVSRTQTRESTHAPTGQNWNRVGKTGDYVFSGYDYKWVSSTYIADADWDYVRSDRYVTSWETNTVCIEYGNFGGYRYCIKEETVKSPVYNYRYLYKIPLKDAVYKWERTVKRTVYDYEYQYPTYTSVSVHQYKKAVQIPERSAIWKKEVYEFNKVYRWTKTSYEWHEENSLKRPTGDDVRNITKSTKDCGEGWNQNEPAICESNDDI